MVEIKLHRNEIEKIKRAIESSKYFGNDKPLCNRILQKLDKALSINPVVDTFYCDEHEKGNSQSCAEICVFCKEYETRKEQ